MELKKILTLLAVAALLTAGCGQKSEDEELMEAANGAAKTAAVLGTASVSGTVSLTGKVPGTALFSVDADPVCKAQHTGMVKDETVITDAKGDLKNVMVYVTDGAGSYPAPSASVSLNQKGCMYSPHVFGIQVGQALEIVNDDPTLHNVHCMAVTNDSFNVGMPNQGMVTEKKFTKAEAPVKFKCDVHGWMHCFAGVFTNPFYAVTGDDGSFKINGLPAGNYTLVAWQEQYGVSAPQTVAVKDGEAKSVNFTFAAAN
jgi:plastocyanin